MRSSTSPTAAILLIAIAAILVLPGAATAAEVHFDSQSPAGKEYALPLPQARNEALGTGAENNSPSGSTLFGVGVGGPEGGRSGGSSPDGTGGHQQGKGTGPQARAPTSKSPNGRASQGGEGAASTERPPISQAASYDGGGTIALLAGLCVLAILVGLGLRFAPALRDRD